MNSQCDSCPSKDLFKELDLVPRKYNLVKVSIVCKGCGVFQENNTYYITKKG